MTTGTRRRWPGGVLGACVALAAFAGLRAADDKPAAARDGNTAGEIRLLVRADDMGIAQAVNEACVESYRRGVARSVEVIVPGPWFLDAVRLLKQNPDLDVGVHLCLTSEWDRLKWRPITRAPSLVDRDGYFFPMTGQRPDFPPDTGFLTSKPKLEEVEAELRAQIETAVRHLGPGRVSHVSAHMGAATATPPLRALTAKLAAEYKLLLEDGGRAKHAGGIGGPAATPEQREQMMVDLVNKLTPGQWLLVEHPGLDTPEMRALGHKGYQNVAEHRLGVTRAFTSDRVKQAVEGRGVRLISYAELKGN